MNRRDFLLRTAAFGAGATLYWNSGGLFARTAHGATQLLPATAGLDAFQVPKYVMDVIVPPAMPRIGRFRLFGGQKVDYYEIAVKQFQQQILPPPYNQTTVWSYGSLWHPGTFNYPAFTIEAQQGVPVRVRWVNKLIDDRGRYLSHILPVDQTLHWANPPGGEAGRDQMTMDPTLYTGPVPIVTHVHGAHTTDESDGYTEAWYLPVARNIPTGYAHYGSKYEYFRLKFLLKRGVPWIPGSATFQYPNDQAASTLWYHDHSLGMTRLNVYAGPAGFYHVRGGDYDLQDGTLPGPAPMLGDPAGRPYYEVPLAIQDRSFNADGSLFYPSSREFFDGFAGPYIPDSDVSPTWNPEFFANAMVVNGRTWPKMTVEPRRYRFRLLNGCNSRFMILRLTTVNAEAAADPVTGNWPPAATVPMWRIGASGGFLPGALEQRDILLAPAERADVLVDFSDMPAGTKVYMVNLGPDEPFGGGEGGTDFDYANPRTTGQVMMFEVALPLSGTDATVNPANGLSLPTPPPLGDATLTRQITLNEEMSMVANGPKAALLGTLDAGGNSTPLRWMDPISEQPVLDQTEIWEIYNFTADAHPMHIHEVQFEVVNRQGLATDIDGVAVQPAVVIGEPRPAEAWETGLKDTVITYPGEVTRVKVRFDLPGLFVWHCHIVEHEDNEMMRPLLVLRPGQVGAASVDAVGADSAHVDITGEEVSQDEAFESELPNRIHLPFVQR